MKHPIESLLLCVMLLLGNAAARAGEMADAAATPPAPAAPAAPVADEEKGVHIKIELDSDDADEVNKDTLVAIDTEEDADEDDGPVGRAIKKGVAEILEEHVLTDADLDEEEREEVIEAIAELRGEIDDELKDVEKEVKEELGSPGKKRSVVINNPMGHDSGDDGFGIFQAVVAIVAIVFTLGMPIIIVSLILFFGYRKRRLAHDTINGYLASGKEIPPEVMQNLFKDAAPVSAAPRTSLHKGTINASIGLGMVIGFNAIDADFLAAIGFVFLLVGLAQLLIWKLEQGKKSEGDSTQG